MMAVTHAPHVLCLKCIVHASHVQKKRRVYTLRRPALA